MLRFGYTHDDLARIATVPMRALAPSAVVTHFDAPDGFRPLMTENDKYGICSFASARNSRRLQEWVKNGTEWVTDTTTIVANFGACAGIPNTDGALTACQGLGMLQVIDWSQKNGFNIGNQTIEVPTVEAINPVDRLGMAHAIAEAGWWGCIGLTQQDVDAIQAAAQGGPMLTGLPVGPVVEGHAIVMSGMDGVRDGDRMTMATWDCFIQATWEWLTARTLAAYWLTWA